MASTGGRRVCVAVDESPVSASALEWAAKSLVHPNDELHLITVIKPRGQLPSDHWTGDPATPWLDATQSSQDSAEAMLQKYAKLALKAGVKAKTQTVTSEDGGAHGVGMSLREYATTHHVDSLVVGSRGLGSFSRSLLGMVGLGSVSDYCVKHVPVPVVVYRSSSEHAAAQPPTPASAADKKTAASVAEKVFGKAILTSTPSTWEGASQNNDIDQAVEDAVALSLSD